MSFRAKVERNEEALCWTCSKLDYDPIYSSAKDKIYPLPFCPIKQQIISKGYTRCKTGNALQEKKRQDALIYALTLEMPRKEEEKDVTG